jgi:hypothetical protein
MRLLLATFVLAAAACSSASGASSSSTSGATAIGNGSGAYSSSSPQLKPDTIAGCNAVNLKVDLGPDGTIRVNGETASMEGVKEAALKKDAACQNAAAMVIYSYDAASPAEKRDAIKLLLKETIVNLSLTEAGQG